MIITLTPFNASLSTRSLQQGQRVACTAHTLCGKHYGIDIRFFSASSRALAAKFAQIKRALHGNALFDRPTG
jgi:hypothetical protein